MNKRTVRILGLLILAVMTVTVFSGCDLLMALFGGKVIDRISSFESDLNSSSRSGIYYNFHPTETTQYDAIKASSYWEDAFPSVYDYEFSGIIASDEELTASATLTVMYGATEYYSGSVYFTFAEDGFDVLIDDFSGFYLTIYQILGTTPVTRE
jgi:hypothetical protein